MTEAELFNHIVKLQLQMTKLATELRRVKRLARERKLLRESPVSVAQEYLRQANEIVDVPSLDELLSTYELNDTDYDAMTIDDLIHSVREKQSHFKDYG